jgi:hypothetical protein
MRRVLNEAMLSAGALTLLLLVLVAVDDRVRDQISMRFMQNPEAELAGAGYRVRALTSIIAAAAREQSIEHAPLVIFALAAALLVILMLRT